MPRSNFRQDLIPNPPQLQNTERKPDPRIEITSGKPPANPPCKYSEVQNNEFGWALFCQILARFLTKYEAQYCFSYAERCPFAKWVDKVNDF